MDKLTVAGGPLQRCRIKVVEIVELAQALDHDSSLARAVGRRQMRFRNNSWEIYPGARAIAR
jgi:hypothetical protein